MSRLVTTLLTAAVAAAAAPAAPAACQDVPVTRLTRPQATAPDGFSAIAGFRVLADGRVLVADAVEQTVAAVNLRTGARTDIGRQGSGPGEYGMPGALFAGAGDTTYMLDMGNRRLLVITPDGRVSTETIPLRMPGGGMVPLFPRGMDRQGRVYFDLAGIMMPGLEENARQGRAPLMRWDRASDRVDTLGYVHFPPSNTRMQAGEVRVQIGGGGPFRPRDAWAVTPDGRVGMARTNPYHVEWFGAGRPATGPEVPWRPVPVTDAEKNAWADRLTQRGMMVEVENGRRSTRRPPRPDINQMEWPETMPPFPAGGVLATADGQLWVERSRPARAAERTYDVFDAQGRHVRQVVVTGGGEVRWVDASGVYVIREDDDGLQWIERYPALTKS